MAKVLSGFTVLPIIYSSSSTHFLYARSHTNPKRDKSQIFPAGRTIFIVNVPPDATSRELVLLFRPCGTIERIVFDWDADKHVETDGSSGDEEGEEKDETDEEPARAEAPHAPKVVPLPTRSLRILRKTGRTAHIVFLDSTSLERALNHKQPLPWPKSEEPSGLSHYHSLYDTLRPPLDIVKEHADSYMELFEHTLAQTKQKSSYRKGESIVDADGFTLVTRGGAYGQTLGGGVGVAHKNFHRDGGGSKRSRKKLVKEKEGFYSFQKAERQRKDLMDLQRKWEEDKIKVEKLKESRRFKPY